jgi:hypothetical protein
MLKFSTLHVFQGRNSEDSSSLRNSLPHQFAGQHASDKSDRDQQTQSNALQKRSDFDVMRNEG